MEGLGREDQQEECKCEQYWSHVEGVKSPDEPWGGIVVCGIVDCVRI